MTLSKRVSPQETVGEEESEYHEDTADKKGNTHCWEASSRWVVLVQIVDFQFPDISRPEWASDDI
jgi:hypothetical protein